jgi:DNA-damage-inducible protein J
MQAEAVVETRIDVELMREAKEIYAAAGLTIEDVIRKLLIRTVHDQSVPFDLFMPNAETVEAMEAARRGELTHFETIDALMADLNADD